jgi:peroxiredoxin
MRKLVTNVLLVCLALAIMAPCALAAAGTGEGDKLTDAELQTLKGKKVSLAELTKGRVSIVKFGATWCGPCTMQLQEFEKLIRHYKKKVLVLDIDIKEPAKTVAAHYARHKFHTYSLLDTDGSVARTYGVRGIPDTLLVKADGTIAARKVGVTRATELKPILDKLLKEAAEASKGEK